MSRFNKGGAKPAPAKPAAPAPAAKKEEPKAAATEAPVFEELLPEKQEVVELSGVRFPVKISNVTAADVSWTFDGEPLDIDKNANLEYEVDEEAGTYCIVIAETTFPDDSGMYRVTAKNDAGEIYSECDLLLEEMPEHVKAALAEYSHK